jgi:hypothetical protein
VLGRAGRAFDRLSAPREDNLAANQVSRACHIRVVICTYSGGQLQFVAEKLVVFVDCKYDSVLFFKLEFINSYVEYVD